MTEQVQKGPLDEQEEKRQSGLITLRSANVDLHLPSAPHALTD